MPKLSKSEIETYQNKGYVIPDYKVPENVLRSLKEALEETLNINANIRPEQLASIHTEKSSADDTVGHSTFLKTALNSELVDLVSGVLGDNIIMWGVQVFCKPGVDGMEVPMHQDGQYWPIRPLKTCTMWLAIDDADRDNGCLQVIPGSHLGSIHYGHQKETRDKLVLNQSIKDPRLENAEFDYIELQAGQLSLHDVFLVHGSQPNTSGRRRAGFTVRYMPSTSVLRRDIEIPFAGYPVNWKEKPLWLAKGKDVSGKNDLTRGHIK